MRRDKSSRCEQSKRKLKFARASIRRVSFGQIEKVCTDESHSQSHSDVDHAQHGHLGAEVGQSFRLRIFFTFGMNAVRVICN